ncbi:FAD-binding oxidoreductase [Luteipulveratus mongoliensis]|uniref:FAD-binding PCMH-type domain-containing protein n=1 Tax=Luteipulveratus mongoliensis TaxID=571913 RepID=A0A0K1JIX1_9MICO|nr:FAD-binding oxidoreductase [Luteipulveratus mongoliensis]AKU16530.1 hypothetical protein VV02_12775 [Luteipulveratus mongoliensis]
MPASAIPRVELHDATDADVVDGVLPSYVARPTSTAQVSAVMKVAAAQHLSVVVRGAGTKSTWGNPPTRCDLVLDLGHMSGVIEHAAGDLIASAQAGTSLAEVDATIADAGQRLGVDEVVPGTTVGGLIASNPSGPRRMALGTVRDLLIGVTVVRADGVIAKAGGKVVKNVAGYDLGKLIIGSFGTLAVITEATFRLHPVPAAATWVTVEAQSPFASAAFISAAVRSQVVPAAVEIDAAPHRTTTVSLLLEGTAQGVLNRANRAAAFLGSSAVIHHEPPTKVTGYPGDAAGRRTLLKITCQISSVPEIAQAAVDLGLHIRGSAGVGVLYASTLTEVPEDVIRAIAALRALTARTGGALVVLDAPPHIKPHLDVWGPVDGLDLMRRVKHEFDPENRLAPGRFVGGI